MTEVLETGRQQAVGVQEENPNPPSEGKKEVDPLKDKFLGNFTKKELDTLRATIARGTTGEEFALFVQTCVNTGLNPFLNQIHCVIFEGRRGRQFSIQISAEGVMHLARKSPGFRGVNAQTVHENDEFSVDLATGKILEHKVSFPRGQIIGGYAIARHKDFEDKILLMDAREVEHMKQGNNAHMWDKWFTDMFKKHMLKRVCKEQYGIDVYEEEIQAQSELEQIDSYTPGGGRKAVTLEEAEQEDSEAGKRKELWDEIEENVPGNIIGSVMQNHFQGKKEDELRAKDLAALKKLCHFEMQQARKAEGKRMEQWEQNPECRRSQETEEFSTYFE